MKKGLLLILLVLTASTVWAAGAPVRIDDGDTLSVQADVTVTSSAAVLIKASNSNRATLNCTTTKNVRWGGSSVTISTGQRVASGSPVAIRSTAAIYMIAEADTSIVSCTEESYSSSTGTVFSP